MCFHKRLLFACSHYAWLTTPESIVPCEVEKRFTRGCVAGYNGNPDGDANDSENETMSELCGDTSSLPQPTPAASGPEEGCNQMWSHGFFTTRVGEDCQSCVRKSRRRQSKISEAREVIRALKTNLEKMTSGELFYCPDENDDSNDLEGGGDERREDWGLTVRSQNSDSTRTSAGIGLESSFTSSPRRSSKTDTVDTSVSLDYRSEKDLGLVEECLVDESESKNERMEEVTMMGRNYGRKNELFVDGQEIASVIPQDVRKQWRDRWLETGSCTYEYDYSRKLMKERREPLLPVLVAIRQKRTHK